jgi:phosphoglycerate dehydrogenase-like enzyme
VPAAETPVIVIEDDPFLRVMQVVLDLNTSTERFAAFADFFSHDEPDFAGYCAQVRARAPGLFPAKVRLVDNQDELGSAIGDATAVVLESLAFGRKEIAAAPRLKAVQKYGVGLRHIDAHACAEQGIKVLTIRRRANIACAEHVVGLMLAQAKMTKRLMGRISPEALADIGFPYRPFDRRHTPNSNWPRIRGVRMLHDATLGIIGFGEIGREIARRVNIFGMRVLYFQRTRLPEAEERKLQVAYVPLDTLLAEGDWVVPQLPSGPMLKDLIGPPEFARMKPGAFIVNVSRPDVVNRAALIDALKSGRLGGFALDPQYEAPGRSDDELLTFDNVILTPHIAAQPRFNALRDCAEMVEVLAREIAV